MASWIWRSLGEPAPLNTYTWFRATVQLDELPDASEALFAADSNAHLWINGVPQRRKVTRFHEPRIRGERVDPMSALRVGLNVVVVLHHNWGDITTFQRTGNEHAGVYFESSWLESDDTWTWAAADEFESGAEQFRGLADGAGRVRFPVRWNGSRRLPVDIHDGTSDLSGWARAARVLNGPWPDRPGFVETPAQRETPERPRAVLAAGLARRGAVEERTSQLSASTLTPDPALTERTRQFLRGQPLVLSGAAGETLYATFDFQRPVHGFPFIRASVNTDVEVTLGYGEVSISAYDGRSLVSEDGWIDVDSVVGRGYADSILPGGNDPYYELPDERTARWVAIHVTFGHTGDFVLEDLGMVTSQYPTDRVGTFEAGAEQISQIVELCLIHAQITMTDAYVDTPGREDGQWIEDLQPRAMLAARWFGDTSLRRLAIRTLAEGQGPDGQLHPFFPSNFPAYPSWWDWSVQWVALLYDEYWWHADSDLVREYWPQLCAYWDALLPDVGADGIWTATHVLGDVRNSVPPAEGESSGLITPWIIERLRWSAVMARAIGQTGRAQQFDATADLMREAFIRHHLYLAEAGTVDLVGDVYNPITGERRGLSQSGQIAPLLDGLIDSARAAQLIEFAFPAPDGSPPASMVRWNNPSTSYRVLKALTVHGFAERAVAHLLERFAPYLPGNPCNRTPEVLQGPLGGPLPEYWISRDDLRLVEGELNPTQPNDVTGSHGWGAVPLIWLHENLLGVTVATPGGAQLKIQPVSAGLTRIKGSTCTPRGVVDVDFDPIKLTLSVELPPQCAATIELPTEFDGKRVACRFDEGTTMMIDSGAVRVTADGGGRHAFAVEVTSPEDDSE